uniref:hypothetical protein n=1 Tax=Dokdonella sp. TaxID=2291710 RepID=UPI002DD679C2
MMADPIDDAIAEAQKAAFRSATAPANVVAIRGGIASIPSGPVCCSVDSFLADTEAPVWVVGGIIQSNYVYAVTAPTNHGKTAVTLVMA